MKNFRFLLIVFLIISDGCAVSPKPLGVNQNQRHVLPQDFQILIGFRKFNRDGQLVGNDPNPILINCNSTLEELFQRVKQTEPAYFQNNFNDYEFIFAGLRLPAAQRLGDLQQAFARGRYEDPEYIHVVPNRRP